MEREEIIKGEGVNMKCPKCGVTMLYIRRYDREGYAPLEGDIHVCRSDGESW